MPCCVLGETKAAFIVALALALALAGISTVALCIEYPHSTANAPVTSVYAWVLCLLPQEYEALIDAALDYYAVDAEEATSVVEERPDSAPVNAYADMDPELVGGIDAFGMEEEDFSDRGGQFVERILELGRVTKVCESAG